jgi:hypothetical protein
MHVDWRIILKWMLKIMHRRHAVDPSGSWQGKIRGSCENADESSGFIRCGNCLD